MIKILFLIDHDYVTYFELGSNICSTFTNRAFLNKLKFQFTNQKTVTVRSITFLVFAKSTVIRSLAQNIFQTKIEQKHAIFEEIVTDEQWFQSSFNLLPRCVRKTS